MGISRITEIPNEVRNELLRGINKHRRSPLHPADWREIAVGLLADPDYRNMAVDLVALIAETIADDHARGIHTEIRSTFEPENENAEQ